MPSSKYSTRRLEIYFASMEERQEFEAWAKAHKAPTSKFLVSQLRRAKERTAAKPQPGKAAKELLDLKDQVAVLKGELSAKTVHLNAAERAKERAEGQIIIDEAQQAHFFSVRLGIVLKERGPIHTEALLTLLDIRDDPEWRKALSAELELLEGAGFVKHSTRGWRLLVA